MEAMRLTMSSTLLAPIIDLPVTLRDREVEVTVVPTYAAHPEKPDPEKAHTESIMGILKQYANPALRELEKGVWERAACEKYLERMNDDCS